MRHSGLWDMPPTIEIDQLIANLARHYDCNAAYACLYDGRQVKIISSINVFGEVYDYDLKTNEKYSQIIGRTIPIIISDARENDLEQGSPYVISGEIRFMAYVPFYTKEGFYYGSVEIDDPDPRYNFTLQDADFLIKSALKLQSILGV